MRFRMANAGFSLGFSSLALLITSGALAEDAAPLENHEALPGLIRLGLPVAPEPTVALAANAGLGFYNAGENLEGPSIRMRGTFSAAWTPLPLLSVRGTLVGQGNFHFDGTSSLYGEPQIAVRLRGQLTDEFHLGGEAELRFIGEEAPNINWGATTPTFRGIAGYQLSDVTWLAGRLGLRIDNTGQAFQPANAIRDADKLTLSASDYNALEFGLGVSHRIGKTEILAEYTLDALLGSGSPSFGQSPMSLSLGARQQVSKMFHIHAALDYSPSARPDPYPDDELIASRPRFSALVGLVARFGLPDDALPEEAEEQEDEDEVPEAIAADEAAITGSYSGQVVDEGGRPMPDVKMVLTPESGEPKEYYTDAEGNFTFSDLAVGKWTLSASTAGFDQKDQPVEIAEGESEPSEVVLYPSLPAGQVRGKVLDLSGEPVRAEITFQPGDKQLKVEADGSFTIDLPPGRYTVKFAHPDFPNQKRYIRIVDKGVVVLNIALEK